MAPPPRAARLFSNKQLVTTARVPKMKAKVPKADFEFRTSVRGLDIRRYCNDRKARIKKLAYMLKECCDWRAKRAWKWEGQKSRTLTSVVGESDVINLNRAGASSVDSISSIRTSGLSRAAAESGVFDGEHERREPVDAAAALSSVVLEVSSSDRDLRVASVDGSAVDGSAVVRKTVVAADEELWPTNGLRVVLVEDGEGTSVHSRVGSEAAIRDRRRDDSPRENDATVRSAGREAVLKRERMQAKRENRSLRRVGIGNVDEAS